MLHILSRTMYFFIQNQTIDGLYNLLIYWDIFNFLMYEHFSLILNSMSRKHIECTLTWFTTEKFMSRSIKYKDEFITPNEVSSINFYLEKSLRV